jgi:hypothetical protein
MFIIAHYKRAGGCFSARAHAKKLPPFQKAAAL